MPFDGIITNAITHELNSVLSNSKIEKINQPQKNEIHIKFRNGKTLFLSANNELSRFHITTQKKENPSVPLNFCQQLRKLLGGAILNNITQINMDRIIKINFDTKNEIGDIINIDMYIEIMGKHSNIIVVDSKGTIINSIKRVTEAISRVRQVVPGIKYILPVSDKNNITNYDINLIDKILLSSNYSIKKSLINIFEGFSPAIVEDICISCNIKPTSLACDLTQDNIKSIKLQLEIIKQNIINKNYSALIYKNQYDENVEFYCLKLEKHELDESISYDTLSEVIDIFYTEKNLKHDINQKTQNLRKSVTTKINQINNKLIKFDNDLLDAKNSDIYRLYGELLLSNIQDNKSGKDSIEVMNYYDNELIKIPLDKKISITKNSQMYYKKYNKLQNSVNHIKHQYAEKCNKTKLLIKNG